MIVSPPLPKIMPADADGIKSLTSKVSSSAHHRDNNCIIHNAAVATGSIPYNVFQALASDQLEVYITNADLYQYLTVIVLFIFII